MLKLLIPFYRYIILVITMFTLFLSSTAQTPGLIIRDGSGRVPPGAVSSVLDPNGNGWSSITTSGFNGGDIGAAYSEIAYKPIPPIFPEPTGDLRRGPTGFFSEIVKADPGGTGFYLFFDVGPDNTANTADDKILVRLRISGLMSGSKGYSALFDTDGKFFGTGTNADPTYQAQTTGTNGNPGFEYEMVYETNFRIALYDVNNSCNPLPPQLIWSIDLSNLANSGYAQTSVAITRDGGDADYFYDFWIPRTAFTGSAGPISPTTPLRVQTTTVMSPQGAICGPVSDLYGDDGLFGTSSSQYIAIIQGQPPFTLNDMTAAGSGVGAVCTAPPAITAPISITATSISGTWTKASFSSLTTATITVYKNGVSIGTTAATSGATWTLTGITVTNNDLLTAKAQAAGESMCLTSNSILIQNCTAANTTVCPTVTCFTDKGVEGTGIVGATLRIYRVLSTGITVDFTLVIPAGGNWGWEASGSTGNTTNVCNTGAKDLLDGTYYITQQAPGQCESACLTPYCVGFIATATPVITTDPVFSGGSTIAGTAVAGSTVRLYVNNILKATATATGGNFSFPIIGYYAQVGDVFTVTAQNTGGCVSANASKTVQCFVSNPIINTTEAGVLVAATQITGKSSEPVGTTVTVYNGATNVVIGTTTVVAGGNWTLSSPTSVAGTTYYARHTGTACGTSGASAIISTLTGTPAARCGTITGPVNENATAASGTLTGSVANTLVTLYIDGTPIGTFTTSNSSWGPIALNTTYLNKIYPGGVFSIGIAEPTRAEVICATTLTVICVPPATPVLSNPSGTAGTTPGTLTYTITNSQTGILYVLADDRTGTFPTQTIGNDRGVSAFGNGGSLILTTNVLPEPGDYRFRISAVKLTGRGCTQIATSNLVNPYNSTLALNDENSTWQDVNVSGGVLFNDFDAENNTQTFGNFLAQGATPGLPISTGATLGGVNKTGTPVANAGTITFAADGSYTFDPDPAFTGTVTIPYRLCDNGNLLKCDTAFLTITVDPLPNTGLNSVIANNDENISYGAAVGGSLFANDRDPQSDAFTVTSFTGGTVGTAGTIAGVDQNGNVVANAGSLIINANGTYTFTPTPGFVGSISVPYIITDANGATSTAILQVDVLSDPNGALNDPPMGGDDFGYTTINKPVTGNFISNDTDPNSNPISYLGVTINPAGPATAIGGPVGTAQGGTVQFYANGTYLYTPPAGYVGPDRLPYTICDVTVVAPQPLCADAGIHLLVGPGINIAGRVWDDANGNVAINGGENATNAGNTLYVNLVDNLGNVVATTPVAANGTYSLANVNPGVNYSLQLTINQGTVGNPAPVVALPPGWTNTGESRNGTIDGGTTGVIDTRNFGFNNTVNFDFGIERLPNTDNHTTNIPQSIVGTTVTLNGGANPPVLSGNDPEDCSGGCSLASKAVIIDAVPANSQLHYNGVLVTTGQQINNFNPSLLQIKMTAATIGSTSTSFQYSYVDLAGKKDPTPAIYTVTWLFPLPITLSSFSGIANKCDAVLQWKTSQEINADKFVVEQSSNGLNFTAIAEIKSANSSTGKSYQTSVSQPTGIMYYRLKLLDKDGKFSYSPIVTVRTSCTSTDYMTVYPNPVSTNLTVSFHTAYKGVANLQIVNAIGQQLATQKIKITAAANTFNLDMSNYSPGMYMLYLADDKGEKIGAVQKVIKN